MNPTICTTCQETNHLPEGKGVIVATFQNTYKAKEALFALLAAHIIPVWSHIFSQEEIAEKTNNIFMESTTLIVELHGIKDIVNLQMLYAESICREKGVLTVDTFSARIACEKILRMLQ